MSIHFLTCATRGCRRETGLALCAVCEQLVCPRHAAAVAGPSTSLRTGGVLCPTCAPTDATASARVPQHGQKDLFT